MLVVCQLHWAGGERVESVDTGLEGLGVHDYGFEIFNADADVESLLDCEVFEIHCVNGNGCL